ncbi:TOBE domain-containing protein [Neisseriaceae bacterium JH1-16]|nr:TOBE domain-containing protein [Neisseriaceae bacterium JH1-16]
MKTSARNQFNGTISALRQGAVNDEVELTLAGGTKLAAVVTRDSSAALGLATGKEVIALVKAPWIVLATGADDLQFSARNQLTGTVSAVIKGAVNSEVLLSLDGGLTLAAVITNDSVDDLQLAAGKTATALFKASSVILAVKK